MTTTAPFVATRPAYLDDDTQPAMAVVGRELWEATHDIIPAVLVSHPDADLIYRAMAAEADPRMAMCRFDAIVAGVDAYIADTRPAVLGGHR